MGGAFDEFNFHKLAFFRSGELIYSPQLHTSVGAEIWLGTTLAYVLNTQFRLGYAYGFSPEAMFQRAVEIQPKGEAIMRDASTSSTVIGLPSCQRAFGLSR